MKQIYGDGVTIPEGLLADPSSSGSISLITFIILIGAFWASFMYILNIRKAKILNETYSKLSIFKK